MDGRGREGEKEGREGGEGRAADRPLQVLKQGGLAPPRHPPRAQADEVPEQGELRPLSEEAGEAEGADQEGVEKVHEVEVAEEEEEEVEEEDQQAAEQPAEEEVRLPQGQGQEVQGGDHLLQEEEAQAEEEDCQEVEVQKVGEKERALSEKGETRARGEQARGGGGGEEGGWGALEDRGKLNFEEATIVSGGPFEVNAKKASEIENSEIPTAQISKEK